MSENKMVEIARGAKSALRKAFPLTKFSVQTSGSICVEWADDGPTVEQVKDVVLTIGGIEAELALALAEPERPCTGCCTEAAPRPHC